MYGKKKEIVSLECHICHKPQLIKVDLEDVERGLADKGKTIAEIFIDPAGNLYLTPAESEMFISKTCEACWKVLCPDDDSFYN